MVRLLFLCMISLEVVALNKLYKLLRILGDIKAIQNGTYAERVARRIGKSRQENSSESYLNKGTDTGRRICTHLVHRMSIGMIH